jgi:hypothetical protein
MLVSNQEDLGLAQHPQQEWVPRLDPLLELSLRVGHWGNLAANDITGRA